MELTKIIPVNNLGTSPACVNRGTGIMLVNKKWFDSLPFEYRYFILLHEKAHLELNTSNEFEVDKWAFDEYVKGGYSLEMVIMALIDNLKFLSTNIEQKNRVLMQIIRAKIYDYKVLGSNTYKDWYNQRFTD